MGRKQNKKEKITLPPDLPPEIPDDEISVSDEDVNFVSENRAYAAFVSSLDTKSINKHVTRVANAKEDDLEALYEKRQRKKALEKEEVKGLEVDRVDALPVKTLDGKVYYRTAPKAEEKPIHGNKDDSEGDEDKYNANRGITKLTKPERRAKLKKQRKEDKRQSKDHSDTEEEQQNTQSEVLAEVQEDLVVEETAEAKQRQMAELGTELLSDPESNIKSLKELLKFCKDKDKTITQSALLSCLVVFKDIIPGYRIRLPTEKEQEMKVSKVVKKMRFFESTLLSSYKSYLQRLIILQERPEFHRVVVRCFCTLLDTHPHFNFRENILPAVVRNLNSSDDVTRKLCSTTIQSLFKNEGKHGGEVTVEAVQIIANLVKIYDCEELHPDTVEVFLSLSFDEDLGRPEKKDVDDKGKRKKNKKVRNPSDPILPVTSDKKRSKQELLSKTQEEVNADYKAASFAPDESERKRLQSDTLSFVFNTYFRILKHATQPVVSRPNATSSGGAHGVAHPLLSTCLKGVGLFAHLIDLDFMADLLKHLKILSSGGSNVGDLESHLTVSERIECCIVAFKVMKKNLDALNVDLQDFFIQLYNLIVEYRPGRLLVVKLGSIGTTLQEWLHTAPQDWLAKPYDIINLDEGAALAEALKIILCDDRQHDMQRAAAFIKRLTTSSLSFGSPEAMAALVTAKNLLQKNVKCRYMLENDVGGGSLAGSIAKYQPYSSDPHLSGALASVLWELNLLGKHYHPAISTMASTISKMTTTPSQVYMPTISPQQAFKEFALERESFDLKNDTKKLTHKRKRGDSALSVDSESSTKVDEDVLRKKLSDHFTIVRDIVENEKLRRELNLTTASLQLHEEYKKQKKSGLKVPKLKQRKQK